MQSSGKWAAESAGIWADLVHLRPRHVSAHKRTRISIYHMIRHMYADASARPEIVQSCQDLPKLPKNPQGFAVCGCGGSREAVRTGSSGGSAARPLPRAVPSCGRRPPSTCRILRSSSAAGRPAQPQPAKHRQGSAFGIDKNRPLNASQVKDRKQH